MPTFFDQPITNKTGGLIADPITAYLENVDKRLDEKILAELMMMFRRSIVKQLMQPRQDRKGHESNSVYSHPCARKARYSFDGAERAPLQSRTLLKFLLGDMVELSVWGIAKLAGLDVDLNNHDLVVTGLSDDKLVQVHPDGLLRQDGRLYNVEIKSCDSKTFDRWLQQGGPNDDWGYLTQATMEIQAWRENGDDVNETVFVAVSTGSRQGSIAEWVLPYQPEKYEAWQERRRLRQQPELPPMPYQPEPELQFKKGRDVDAALMGFGEPAPRLDKNQKVYGWDYPTGRQLVPFACTYCDFLKLDYPTAEMEMDGSRPIWVVPATPSKLFLGPEMTPEARLAK